MSVAPILSIREYTYRILGHIGQGELCSVYRASVEHLDDTEVAIKIISPEENQGFLPTDTIDFRGRFHSELRAYSELCGGPIPSLFDFRLEGQLPFLITKWAGNSLRSLLNESRGPLSTQDAERCIHQIFKALAELHAIGFAHGSLDPSHILQTKDRITFCSLRMSNHLDTIAPPPPDFHTAFCRFSAGELDCMLASLIAFQVATGVMPVRVLQCDPEGWVPHIIPPPRYINPTLSIRVEHLLLRGLNFGRGVPPSAEDLFRETTTWNSQEISSPGSTVTNYLLTTPAGLGMSNDSDNPIKRGGDRISRTHPTLGDDSEMARASRAKTEIISAETMNQLRDELIAQAVAQTNKDPSPPPVEEPAPPPKPVADPGTIVGFSGLSQIPPYSQPRPEEEPQATAGKDDLVDSETDEQTGAPSGAPPWEHGALANRTPSSFAAVALVGTGKSALQMREDDEPEITSLPPASSRRRMFILTAFGITVGGVLALYLTKPGPKGNVGLQQKPPGVDAANRDPLKVDNRSLFPGVSGELTFPFLPSGLYTGVVKDIIPNTKLPIVVTSFDNGKRISVILGIEGFMPVVVEQAPDATDIRITANGMSLRFTGEARGSAIGGTVENLFTREVGVWKALPIH